MDAWTDRLSEYVDGDLDATSAEALEQHLRECADCAAITADLRFIKASAASLESTAPAHDLWSGIAAQIAGDTTTRTDVIDIATKRAPRRQITMSMPQFAAAAIVLIALGGAAMWAMRPSNNGSYATADQQTGVIRNASKASPSTSARQTDALPSQLGYDAAIEQLEQAAAANKDKLDPKTMAVIEKSMVTIDRAIADARAALASDPANAYLHRHLDRTMKQKLELLRQAAKVDRGGA